MRKVSPLKAPDSRAESTEELTHVSLFSGIGGIDLAAEWAGFKTVAFVERDPFCQKVLAKHWPEVPIYDDVTTFDGTPWFGVDLLTGGFPCQDISQAGKQEGLSGHRSGLWFRMLEIIEQSRPAWVVAENVSALTRMGIDTCFLGLENAGYSTRAVIVPACGVGAPHRRERVFLVGHSCSCGRSGKSRWGAGQEPADGYLQLEENPTPNSQSERCREERPGSKRQTERVSCGSSAPGDVPDTKGEQAGGLQFTRVPANVGTSRNRARQTNFWAIEPPVGRVANGVPNRVDRLRALGNAVVPQQVFPILNAIAEQIRGGNHG